MAKIQYKNITKRFGTFEAVKKLNLTVEDQEFVTLVGPSGCGKTTSLRMLAGLTPISEGEIFIGDTKVNDLSPKNRDIAMVFQSYALYPHYTIYDNLAFGLRTRDKIPGANLLISTLLGLLYLLAAGLYLGLAFLIDWLLLPNSLWLIFGAGILGAILMLYLYNETRNDIKMALLRFFAPKISLIEEYLKREEEIRKKVNETADLLEIKNQLWKKPKQLSGGQRQRVALGRSIIRNPKAFLMDEPLSNLDAKLRVQMRAELERLTNRLHITTVYVTHDQIEAMTLSDRILVMKDGIAHQVGTPEEVYQKPTNKFVAGFIGSPPMNFVYGKIEKVEDGFNFVSDAFSLPVPSRYNSGISEFEGKGVIFGIRPEHIELSRNMENNHLTATIGVLEPIGAETYVYIDFPSNIELIVKEEGIVRFKLDEKIGVDVVDDKIHFFDAETELRILPEGGLEKTHHQRELDKQELENPPLVEN